MDKQRLNERKVREIYFGDTPPLNGKKYEVLSRKIVSGEWNDQGRKYSLRGLHSFLGTNDFDFEFEGGVAEEVVGYGIQIRRLKRERGI